jgi:hypothetical protein
MKSYSSIAKYINKKCDGLDINNNIDTLYIPTVYSFITIELDMIQNIIHQIPTIIKIYFNKMEKFEVVDVINIISRILIDQNFKTILTFLKNMNNKNNNTNNNTNNNNHNNNHNTNNTNLNYSYFIYNTWSQIIYYLEKEKDEELEYLINKLCENGFKYGDLDYRIIKKIKKNRQILIKFDQYASQDYQDLINHMADLFGDPITGDIIKEVSTYFVDISRASIASARVATATTCIDL